MRSDRRLHTYFVLGLAVLVHVFLFLFFGVRDQFVDSQRYIEMSDHLIGHGRLEYPYQFFYAVPIMFLALFRLFFGEGLLVFVLFQSMLSVTAAFALYRSGAILFQDKNAGLMTAVIFLLWFDCLQWNTAVMTESIAASITCFVIYLLTIFDGKPKHYLMLTVLLLVGLMTRPTGVLMIVGAAVFLLSRYRDVLNQYLVLKGSLYTSITIVFFIGAWHMLNEWDFTDQYVKGNIVTYMDVIKGESLYDETLRLDTTDITLPDPVKAPAEKIVFFILDNPFYFLQAAVLKVFYVISFYRPYFSTMHNLYTLVWLSIVYLLFFFGLRRIHSKPLRNFAVTVIIANCLLVALSAADWDNRFYMPMQPCIVLLAGGGSLITRGRVAN